MRGFLLAAAASLLALAAPAQQQFGFVDVQEVFKKYAKAKELQDQLEKDFEQMKVAQRREKEKVAAMRESVDVFVAGTKEHLDMLRKIRLAEVEIELNEQVVRLELQVKWAEALRRIYKDVLVEVKAMAEEKGLKGVFMYQSSEIAARNRDDVMNNILVRPVLYFDPASDITADLVTRLNK
jgi:Skp family chaperone for outer membrane proteins